MIVLLFLIGLATAFIAGLLVGRAPIRPDRAASRRDATGPRQRIREERRRNGGRNEAPRTPRPDVRPTPHKS